MSDAAAETQTPEAGGQGRGGSGLGAVFGAMRGTDVALALGVVAILLMLIVPMPSWLLDFALAAEGEVTVALAQGADGGITMSAHIEPRAFAGVRNKLLAGDQAAALSDWYGLSHLPELLFDEPSPAPVKHWLWRMGLIDSPELRLPMTGISEALAQRIDRTIETHALAKTA